jgi:hypothetical protein
LHAVDSSKSADNSTLAIGTSDETLNRFVLHVNVLLAAD